MKSISGDMKSQKARHLPWLLLILVAASAQAYTQDLVLATDINPDPDIFEMNLAADEALIDVDGDGSPDQVFAFNGTVPGPTLLVKAGDIIVVHFTNNLNSLPTTIHWHGIEVNNESDGTPVVQPEIPPGETFTYQFRAERAGNAWYHPHIEPTDQTFRGLYGAVVMLDPREQILADAGVLPPLSETKTVVLSDITVCDGTEASGVCAGTHCGNAGGVLCGAGQVPFVQPDFDCRLGGATSCRVALGTSVLINGAPLKVGNQLDVSNGNGVRLRLANASIQRYFRLVPPAGHQFFRVGGEGGLLDQVRLEGGTEGMLDTLYNEGEIVLSPGSRADVVLVSSGADQDILTVTVTDYANTTASEDLLRFRIVGNAPMTPYSIAEGDPLLTHPLVNDPLVPLPSSGVVPFIDPATLGVKGSADSTINLQAPVLTACLSSDDCHPGTECRDVDMGMDLLCPSESTSVNCSCVDDGMGPAIDGVRGIFDAVGSTVPSEIPHLTSSRWAYIGDLLELRIVNSTNSHHPFHLHGFEFQPIRVEDDATNQILWEYDYVEFVDNVDIQPGHVLVFRVRLTDRPTLADVFTGGTGGAAGRWLFHCHIIFHAGLGMISELVVLENPFFEDGFESGDTIAWSSTFN